jgi:hypothetical protein
MPRGSRSSSSRQALLYPVEKLPAPVLLFAAMRLVFSCSAIRWASISLHFFAEVPTHLHWLHAAGNQWYAVKVKSFARTMLPLTFAEFVGGTL